MIDGYVKVKESARKIEDIAGIEFTKSAGHTYASILLKDGTTLHEHYEQESDARNRVAALSSIVKTHNAMPATTASTKEKPVFKELFDGFKKFITENRTIIYWLAVAFLADHFFFKGAFREKLHELVNKIIGRVEKQIDNA